MVDSAQGKSPHIKDGTDQSFMVDVIEASKTQPVIVDFWAPWCGPCRTLGPTIEKAITARNGKVKLVKINIDENPGVAGQLGVRSIPTVYAFADGRGVDGFMGALPESQINAFLDKVLAGGGGGPSAQEIEQVLAMAGEAFRQGDAGTAAQAYAAILEAVPENIPAIAGLARCFLVSGDIPKALETLELAPQASRNDPELKSVRTAIELSSDAAPEPDALATQINEVALHPTDADRRFALAEALAAARRNEEAVEHLLILLGQDLNAKDGAAKALLLKLFDAEGPKSKLTVEGRRRLSALMFA